MKEVYLVQRIISGLDGNVKYDSKKHYPIFIAKQAAMYADALIVESQSRSEENDKAFCVKAEAFVNFLSGRDYQTLWGDNDELFYYSGTEIPTRHMPASEVLSLFEDWENR